MSRPCLARARRWPCLFALLWLAGCADGGPGTPAAEAGPEALTRARVGEVLAAAAGGGESLAPFVRYLGSERELRYARAATYEGPQVRELDSIAARIRGHAALGAPTFVGAEVRTLRDPPWVAWTLSFGPAATAQRVIYAFVKVGDAWLLGDIDDLN